MSDEIDYGKLSDRELLLLVVQSNNVHSKRLDAHAHDIKSLREWRQYISGGIAIVAGALGIHLKAGGH